MKLTGLRRAARRAPKAAPTSARAPRPAIEHSAERARWEVEAARAATAAAAGTATPRLTPAPTAAVPTNAGPGAPLPPPVRRRLERAFGAGLGAVRLHTDAVGRALARAHHADGFAAGNHVFLDAATSELSTERGYTLLAHEVAHALQQTSASVDGHVAVTDRVGRGALQFSKAIPDFLEKAKVLRRTTPAFSDVKTTYVNAFGAGGTLGTEIKAVEALLGADDLATAPTSTKTAIASRVFVAKTASAPAAASALFAGFRPEAQGFYLDVLTAMDLHAEAAVLQDLEKRAIPTRNRSLAFYEHVRGAGATGIAARIAGIKEIRDFFPGNLSDAFRISMFGASQMQVPLQGVGKLGKAADAAANARIDGSVLGNEFDLAAIAVLVLYDGARKITEKSRRDVVDASRRDELGGNPAADLRAYAADAAKHASEWLPSGEPEFDELTAAFAPTLATIGARAEAFWDSIARSFEVLRVGDAATNVAPIGALGELEKVASSLGAHTDTAKVDATLATALATALAEPKKAPPTPDAVKSDRKQSSERLAALRLKLGLKIIDLARKTAKPATGSKPAVTDEQSAAGVRLGLAVHVVRLAELLFRRYDPKVDAGWRTKGALDYWISERIRLAHFWQPWAITFGLTGTASAVADFQTPDRGEIALLGTWKPSPEPERVVTADLENTEIHQVIGTGLSVGMLDVFGQALYFELLTGSIREVLNEWLDYPMREKTVLAEAAARAELQRTKPRCYVMNEAYWYLGDDAKTPGATPRTQYLFDLILQHPRIAELAIPDTSWPVTSSSRAKQQHYGEASVFVWELPRIDLLVAELQQVPVLDQRVRAHWKTTNGTDPPATMAWRDWLYTLGDLTTALKTAGTRDPANKVPGDPAKLKDQEALAALVTGRLTARHATASTALDRAKRDATSHDRKVIETNVLFPALQRYDRHDISRYQDEDTIRGALVNFMLDVVPKEDAGVQTAALVIEGAPSIVKAFGDEGGLLGTGTIKIFSVIRWLTPLLGGTLRAWDDPTTNPHIRAVSWLKVADLEAHIGWLRTLYGTVTVARNGQRSGTGLLGRVEGLRSESRMIGRANAGTVSFPDWKASFKVGDDNQFQYEGRSWNLKQVHHDFVWLPPVPLHPMFQSPWKQRDPAGDSLLFGADGRTPIPKTTQLMTVQYTDMTTFTVYEQTILGNQSDLLDKLAEAVVVNDIAEQLKALGEAIETVTGVILDILEFIPGWGQGIMALRFIQAIVQFLTDKDFQELIALFKEDGIGAIGKLLSKASEMFDLETLLMWLLFRSERLPFTAPAPTKPKNPKREQMANRSGKFAVVGTVVRNVLGFGKNLVKSVERVRVRAQGPVRSMRLWVLEHPMASMLLDFIVDTALPAAMLTVQLLAERTGDDPTGDPDVNATLGGAVAESIEGIVQGAADAVATLALLELPEEIIPLEAVVDFLLDQVIQKLGTKYKVGLKVARAGLQKLGVWSRITGAIADGFRSIGGDPNAAYRSAVRDNLQPYLDKVRTTLLEKLQEHFGSFQFVKDLGTAAAPKAPQTQAIEVDFHGSEFPESQASLATDDGFPALTGPLPTPSGGDRLPPSTLASHEQTFGADFSHVRLHTGADAAAVTSRFHADGLTTGSHVYLRPNLDPGAGAGAQVLAHELSHVRDQTGPRPLGAVHDDRPASGTPGRGLVWDPASEARAEGAARGDVPAAAGAATGVQPSLTVKFLTDFVKELKNPDRLAKQASRLEEIEKTKVDFTGDPKSKAIADGLAAALVAAFSDSKVFTINKPFDQVRKKLVDYVTTGALGGVVSKAMPHLVSRARTNIKLKKKTDREATEAWYVSPALLDAEISEFLYGETGLAVRLKLATAKDLDLDNRDAVVATTPIKAIELVYLHVPFMHGTAGQALLVDAAKATWPSVTAAKEQGFLVGIAGLLVARLGPRPDIWDSAKFKFHASTKRRIEEQKGSLEKVIKAKHWPTPGQYVQTDPSKVVDDGSVLAKNVVDIGLRLGTYATWGPAGKSGSPDRDAHHITQYVFFQYLSNAKMLKPFPTIKDARRNLLGIKPATGTVTSIAPVGTNAHKTIDVAKYEAGRGGEMATIYIARNTHRSDVHLRGESPDDDATRRESQGGTVDNIFRAGVRQALNPKDGIDVLDHKATLVALAGAPSPDLPVKTPAGTFSQADVNRAVFAAVRHLYKEMSSDMNPRLKRAMLDQEPAYYNLVAAQRNVTPRLETAAVEPVFTAAIARNQQVIGVDAGVDP
ncbi:MAG: DUF4157 domain-containing protein [Myxococcales bacterium]|nr:DUF4157 domain-containing protein [Myxococcales bacterium]